jgi:hypothetical protein
MAHMRDPRWNKIVADFIQRTNDHNPPAGPGSRKTGVVPVVKSASQGVLSPITPAAFNCEEASDFVSEPVFLPSANGGTHRPVVIERVNECEFWRAWEISE